MAGYMYLGSQRVCPVIVSGSSEPTTCVFRVPDDVTEISREKAFVGLFYNVYPFTYDIAIDFNNVEVVSGNECFETTFVGCNIVSLKDKIKTVSARMPFNTCFGYATIPEESTIFENLESITAEDGLHTALLYSLGKQIYRFKKLSYIANRGMEACFGHSSAKHIYFNSLKSDSFEPSQNKLHFTSMLMGVTGCTLHLPSNLSSVIPTLSGYPNFGGTNTVILYDLPATN